MAVCIDNHFAYCIWRKLVPFPANQPFDFGRSADIPEDKRIGSLNLFVEGSGVILLVNELSTFGSGENSALSL